MQQRLQQTTPEDWDGNPVGRPLKYGWDRLTQAGWEHALVIKGVDPDKVRRAALSWARDHGMVFRTQKRGPDVLAVWRLS